MTSTGTYQGLAGDRKSSKVLKPPGGGSSDIFGAPPEETSPRRVKNHNQSQLGSALFGDTPNSNGTGNETPRSAPKPGNDSYNRLFGPPDAPPTTPNAKNHMRSNISLSGESSSSLSSRTATSPAKSTASSNSTSALANGFAGFNGNNLTNDITAFRRNKRFRGASCLTRNPVTGYGIDDTPARRIPRKCRDGNPVTGTGYTETQNNGPVMQNGTSSSSSSIGEKSNDSSPSTKAPTRTRVPPGGYSSGLW